MSLVISTCAFNGIDPVTKLVISQFLHNFGIVIIFFIVMVVMVGVHNGIVCVKGDTMTSQLRVPVSVFVS